MSEFKNDSDVFAPSNTGTQAHAFLGSRGAKPGNLRAACRVTIQRSVSATFTSLASARKFYSVCESCVKLYLAAEARAEASMQPATEADDLGYVAPVDERTKSAPKVTTVDGRTVSFEPKPAEATPQHEQMAHPDLSTEDGTVTLGRDTLTRRGPWADVTLATGRKYVVSMKVGRKADHGTWRVLFDNVTYWAERDGRSFGPTRSAGENDKPGSVGGRIWALLIAANIA
jgi:hypothetical protein